VPLPSLGLRRSVGPGRANRPEDLGATRRALADQGYLGPHAARPSNELDWKLDEAIRRFQRDHGLTVDGWLAPGGETDRALGRATEPTAGTKRKAEPTGAIAAPGPDSPPPPRQGPSIDAGTIEVDPVKAQSMPPNDGLLGRTKKSGRGSLLPGSEAPAAPPSLPPVSAETHAANTRLAEVLAGTTDLGPVPNYIVGALMRGGKTAQAEVADLLEQYAARDLEGAQRLSREVIRRFADPEGEHRRLRQEPDVIDDSRPETYAEGLSRLLGVEVEEAVAPALVLGAAALPDILLLLGVGGAATAAIVADQERSKWEMIDPLPPLPGFTPEPPEPEQKGGPRTEFPADPPDVPQLPPLEDSEDGGAQILIYPELDEALLRHLKPWMESRGDEFTQNGNRLVLKTMRQVMKEYGEENEGAGRFEHIAGSHKDGVGEPLPECVIGNTRQPGYSKPDIIVHDSKSGNNLLINTGKFLKSRPELIASERRQLDRLIQNARPEDTIIGFKKLRPDSSNIEEYEKELIEQWRVILRPIIKYIEEK
jgi:peptidoglycan hydrolase-like protein with peptidoglycan-binding domain